MPKIRSRAPFRDPLHIVDRFQRLLAQVVRLHGDEPLLGGAEDDRLLAAPAVRVGVADTSPTPTRAPTSVSFSMTLLIGVKDELAAEEFQILEIFAVIVDRVIDIEPVLQAHFVVVLAVAGGGVNAAGTGLQGDMLAEQDDRVALVEGVARSSCCSRSAALKVAITSPLSAGCLEKRLLQPVGNDQHSLLRLQRHIVEFGMERNCQVGRDRPGGSRPDDDDTPLCRPAPGWRQKHRP